MQENFEKCAPLLNMLMRPLVDQITDYFDEHPDYDDDDPFIFFFGHLRVGKAHPDPDARIGYCAAKKLAFIGYRASVVLVGKTMAIDDFLITETNVPDCHSGHELLVTKKDHGTLRLVGIIYGDNA